jgi:hypothetical protein
MVEQAGQAAADRKLALAAALQVLTHLLAVTAAQTSLHMALVAVVVVLLRWVQQQLATLEQ